MLDETTTTPLRPNWFKPAAIVIGGVFFLFALLSSLGIFNEKPYTEVPHGNHSHFVPKDRDPNVPMHNFPQQPPPTGMKIAPDGQIVPE
jgi:hypothetical protein